MNRLIKQTTILASALLALLMARACGGSSGGGSSDDGSSEGNGTEYAIAIRMDNEELAKMMVNEIKPQAGYRTERRPKSKTWDYGDAYYLWDIFAHYDSEPVDEAIAKYEQKFGKFSE